MNRFLKLSLMTTLAGVVGACNSTKMEYPAAPTDESVTDEYFGTTVADPYRPLENDTAPATLEWVKAENALTEAYLSEIPFREKFASASQPSTIIRKPGFLQKRKTVNIISMKTTDYKTRAFSIALTQLEANLKSFSTPTLFPTTAPWPFKVCQSQTTGNILPI